MANLPWEITLQDVWDGPQPLNTATVDCTPLVHAAAQSLKANHSGGVIRLGPYLHRFCTPLDRNLLSGILIEGVDMMRTILRLELSTGCVFYGMTGHNGFTGGGIRSVTFTTLPGQGAKNFYPVYMAGTSVYQPDDFILEDINITADVGTSIWTGVVLNGVLRGSPQGIRVGRMRNVRVFCCSGPGFDISNTVELQATGLQYYPGHSGGSVAMALGGQSNGLLSLSQQQNASCYLDNCELQGSISIARTRDLRIAGSRSHASVSIDWNTSSGISQNWWI